MGKELEKGKATVRTEWLRKGSRRLKWEEVWGFDLLLDNSTKTVLVLIAF